jgi:hypothetical protein
MRFWPLSISAVILCGVAAAQTASIGTPSDVESVRAEIAHLKETIEQQQKSLQTFEEKLDSQMQASLAAPEKADAVSPSASDPGAKPLDISGYFSSRYSRVKDSPEAQSYEQQTMSLFFDKTLGFLQLHSELEYEYGSEVTPFGRSIGPASGEFNAETAWLDYTYRDWLKGRAGIFLTPTYWSLHHYPSTTLTVENPLMYERIFPANVVGTMAHGSRYFENGGFDYSIYAGKGTNFEQPEEAPQDGRGAVGGTFLVHLPVSHFFRAFDTGIHLYRDKPGLGLHQQIYGFENRIEKGAFEFLGELAHSDVRSSTGKRRLFREGYYLQPAWRVSKGLHVYYRYDWLKFDSTDTLHPFTDENTAGINFRPIPSLSLKLEWNELRAAGSLSEPKQGFGAGLGFFFQ